MLKEEDINDIDHLFGMPLFKMGLLKFFRDMQEGGIASAKNYWSLSYGRDFLIPKAPEIFEKLIDFYIILGFVPRTRHEKALEENEKLKEENKFLKGTLRELQDSVLFSSAGELNKRWPEIAGEKTALNNETAQNLLEVVNR